MFKFNFGADDCDKETIVEESKQPLRECIKHDVSSLKHDVSSKNHDVSSKEHDVTNTKHDKNVSSEKDNSIVSDEDMIGLSVAGHELYYVTPHVAQQRSEGRVRGLVDHSDLESGLYEGGFKVWECTFDLLDYLSETDVSNKRVLDLGCGAGLLGMYAHCLGASHVCYQDYNSEVIEEFTLPAARKSLVSLDKCSFYSGDWDAFASACNETFDVILSSETIYSVEYYPKLLRLLNNMLSKDGVAFFAAKTYYFGVGGGTVEFINFCKSCNFNADIIKTFDDGVNRELLRVSRK